jgi:predicted GH43/DUF377 family glycosyl hydrolase
VTASAYPTLFRRHTGNPILHAGMWPYPAHTVFNPGATLLTDGTTLLLCRVEDRRGHSHLCAARSANGLDGWVVDRSPRWSPIPSASPRSCGASRIRASRSWSSASYAVAYTAYSRSGPGVALAMTQDFRSFERYGLIMQPDDKDAAVLPHRIDGSFAMLHRPMPTRARTSGSRTPRSAQLGPPQAAACRRGAAPGGTPTRSACRRR